MVRQFVSNLPKCKSGKKITFTQINDSQFFIEGNSDNTKIGGESEYSISYIDFDGGPLLHIGHDFLGRGKIISIDLIDSEKPNYIITKITLKTEK
jgi:hypothetical protein